MDNLYRKHRLLRRKKTQMSPFHSKAWRHCWLYGPCNSETERSCLLQEETPDACPQILKNKTRMMTRNV